MDGAQPAAWPTGPVKRLPAVIQLFQQLRKSAMASKGGGGGGGGGGSHHRASSESALSALGSAAAAGSSDPSDLFQEINSKSGHANQVREDVERYGEMIEKLADTIKRERPADMPALMAFVQHADGQLAQLSDEHATLKFFEWPEAKYDCFREASALCHELWTLKESMLKVDHAPPKKTATHSSNYEHLIGEIAKVTEKVKAKVAKEEGGMDGKVKKFKDNHVPWDTAILEDLKKSTLMLVRKHMSATLGEAAALQAEEGGGEEAQRKAHYYLTSSVYYAFKAHQFTGGFDSECTALFAELSEAINDISLPVDPSAIDL